MSYDVDKLKMGVNFDFKVKFHLEGQGGPPPPKKKKKKKKLWGPSPRYLVILYLERVMSYRMDKLVITAHRDPLTDRRRPEGQNWPRVKRRLKNPWFDVIQHPFYWSTHSYPKNFD